MVQFYLRQAGCFVMDATDRASIAGDHQLHEGLPEGTAVRRGPIADRTWAVGASSAFALCASAMAIWWATRLPVSSSWLVAIVGWIVGFNLAIFIVEIAFIALLAGR
jgi:hypothetical protein